MVYRTVLLRTVLLVVTVAFFFVAGQGSAQTYVRGYYRSNGTYVAPHYRSNPDGNFYNNWSTFGNINPYTGSMGTRLTPTYSPSYFPRTTIPSYTPSYYPQSNYGWYW
jgi:hypothetical protein